MANLHHRTSVLLVCQRMPSASLFQVSTPSSKSSLGAQRKGHHAFSRLLNWCGQSCRLLHTYQRLWTPGQRLKCRSENSELQIITIYASLCILTCRHQLYGRISNTILQSYPYLHTCFFCEAAMQALFPLPGSTEVR